jgi:hypothetical protein
MGIQSLLERFMQAMCESREREATRVMHQHAHFVEQAAEYERTRAIERARRAADAKTIAEAKATIAQAGMQFVPWSAP